MKNMNDSYIYKRNTCSELRIVNIHANTTVFSFTASSPNTQVEPRMGITIIAAFSDALKKW